MRILFLLFRLRGSNSIPERARIAFFAHFLCQKCGFAHFLGGFFFGAPIFFRHINVFAVWALWLRNLRRPFTGFRKMLRTPNVSKICPDNGCRGSYYGDPNVSKISRKVRELSFSILGTNFRQIWAPLIRTPKNNRRDNFWTNFWFGAFLSAGSGRRI